MPIADQTEPRWVVAAVSGTVQRRWRAKSCALQPSFPRARRVAAGFTHTEPAEFEFSRQMGMLRGTEMVT